MKLTDLKKQLNTMEQKELVALICKLYKGDKQAQSIIDIELCGASVEEQLVSDCKKKIRAAFFGSKLSLKNARTVISNFKKALKSKENIAELMLSYVECGVEFTNIYGDIDEDFYYSIESMFADFVRLINTFDNPDYYDRNAARIKKVCNDSEGIGWGFSEEMMSIYYEIEWHEEEEENPADTMDDSLVREVIVRNKVHFAVGFYDIRKICASRNVRVSRILPSLDSFDNYMTILSSDSTNKAWHDILFIEEVLDLWRSP